MEKYRVLRIYRLFLFLEKERKVKKKSGLIIPVSCTEQGRWSYQTDEFFNLENILLKLYYFSDKYYIDGVEEININGNIIKIYNIEKTICDCLRYGDKISKDIIIESVKEYVKRRDKNISKLMNYAAKAKVKDVVQKYMEVLM